MKIDRLFGLTIYLLNHGRTSAERLAGHFEVSKRTIVRDMETLCMAGIPISSTFGAEGGYEINPDYVMRSQVSNQKDYSNIVMALQGLSTAYQNQEIETTLEKMRSLNQSMDSGMQLDLSAAREKISVNELLDQLNQAITAKHVIEFTYSNAAGEKKLVQAEPVYTIYQWYHWYLVAYNKKHEDYRMYKLLRMEAVKQLPIPNSIMHSQAKVRKLLESKPDARTMLPVCLYCDQSIKARCREYLNGRITKEYEDGSFTYEMTVPENEAFWYGVVLSFGSHAKVLEPDSLKQRIIKDCKSVLLNYEE